MPGLYRIRARVLCVLLRLCQKAESWIANSLGLSQQTTLTHSIRESIRQLANLVAMDAWQQNPTLFKELFLFGEELGIHITPDHYYFPIPNIKELTKSKQWNRVSELPGLELNLDTQMRFLEEIFPKYHNEWRTIPKDASELLLPYEFHFHNGMFDGVDALVLYCMVRHYQPNLILEIGSGWSTRLSATAARINGNTKIVCIEPYPDSFLVNGFPGLDSLMIKRVEDIDVSVFLSLDKGDILFIDSSHVLRTGGDLPYIYLEILPRLKTGVIIHVHDIFFPQEYPEFWITEHFRFWTEQYLLQAFLAFNSHYKILFANNYIRLKYEEKLRNTFPECDNYQSTQSIWIEKIK